jgi:hypothetical protein
VSQIKILIELSNWMGFRSSLGAVGSIGEISSRLAATALKDFDNLEYQEKILVLSELGFSSPGEMQEFLPSLLRSLPPLEETSDSYGSSAIRDNRRGGNPLE